ncbi:MAG TPA: hypothetical protein VJ226_08495, partial [Bradyrhizobium sp.]|nr:hypothetical protein [Bradyrhizobium sp.]
MSDPTPVTDPDILARFNAGAPKPVDDPDVLARFEAEQPRHGAAADVALSTGTGLIKGAAALGGIGGDLAEAGKKAADWVGGKFGSGRASDQPPAAASGPLPEPEPAWESDSFLGWLQKSWEREREWGRRQSDIGHGDMPGSYQPPTSAQLQGSIENVTGPLHQPETTPGRYARTVAEFVPAALATGGESVVPSIVKGAVLPGLGSEYLGSKVEGTWMEPWARLLGALGGGVSGAAGSKGLEAVANRSAASTAARDAAAALTPAGGEAPLVTRGAVARVARNYADDELTPQNIAAQQSGLGPEAMMLDMGRQMQGRAEAIASQPGKGQNNILNQVETRTGGTNPITGRPGLFGQGTADRIKDTLDQSMGPSPDIVAYQKQVNDAVDRISKPLYDQVMTAHPVVNVPDAISSRPAVAEAMKRAVSLAKNYGEKLEGPAETKTILSGPGYHIADDVTPQAQPSLRYWDYVKKAMDQRIRGIMQSGDDLSSAEKADLGGLQSARTALVNHLDDVTGGAYAVARKVAATKPEVKDAIELGRSSLSTKLLPEELADEMQGMSLPERAAAKAGMRREIDR